MFDLHILDVYELTVGFLVLLQGCHPWFCVFTHNATQPTIGQEQVIVMVEVA